MTKKILLSIGILFLLIGCASAPMYKLPVKDSGEPGSQLVVLDSRAGNTKYYSEGNCEYNVTKRIQLGDENFSPDRLSFLKRYLATSLPEKLNGHVIELVNFDTFIVQEKGCKKNDYQPLYTNKNSLLTGMALAAIKIQKHKEDVSDHILTTITIYLDGKKFYGEYKVTSAGHSKSFVYDQDVLDVEVVNTIKQALIGLIDSVKNQT